MADDPLWYKDAVIYELHVRAFYDSAGDGVGDFKGLTQKLDYLQDLGVTALWLLPFYPSPLKDDGYDIADYTDVHPAYGTLGDFRAFLREAHRLGLRVITELVLNHTSEQHSWFQRARRARPGTKLRDFYVWSDTADRFREARVIFKDFESSNWTWDPAAKAYYWHRFYSHQPDLNYGHPEVREAMLRVLDFWMRLGVDGVRLDAVPYLFEREGTNCENLPEGHEFLRELRRHLDRRFPGRMLLAEANQWPEDAAAYFGAGDECHMAFHFPIMPRLYMALRMEDRFPVVDVLEQTPPIPESCQWALFLRNHDELTLEMVTEEERDYMYRVYSADPRARVNLGIRRRLAPLLGNNRRKIELMNSLLLALPGTPVIYYGDEIGMGDNYYLGDRNGVRTPMQWSPDRNAGFSAGNPQRLYLPVITDPEYHYETVNVEAQRQNPSSLLWWMKRLIALRRRHPAFGRGSLEVLPADNPRVLAFLRRHGAERILVVANLSRFSQAVHVDLSAHKGLVPVELFGRAPFPPAGEAPSLFTLGPHSFFWLSLEAPPTAAVASAPRRELPVLDLPARLDDAAPEALARIAALLPDFLPLQRWFGTKAHTMQRVELQDVVPIATGGDEAALLLLLRVHCAEGEPQAWSLPVALSFGSQAERLLDQRPQAVLARARVPGRKSLGLLHDAAHSPSFARALLVAMARGRRAQGRAGEIAATGTAALRRGGAGAAHLKPAVLDVEQSNTSCAFGERFLLKLFRRVEEGVNPELEVGRFLAAQARFPHVPPLAGALEYEGGDGVRRTLAVLHGWVRNQGDAWSYTLDALDDYFEQLLSRRDSGAGGGPPPAGGSLVQRAAAPAPGPVAELLGRYLDSARLLGQRTAELHLALASEAEDPAFAPEPFGTLYQRSVYQSMRNLAGRVLPALRARARALPPEAAEAARTVLQRQDQVVQSFHWLVGRKIETVRIRIHGDYHLGQVLWTGKDFVIMDFEGEPARPLGERRIKRHPLRDVAGMLRSFDYAAHAALRRQEELGIVAAERAPQLRPWARAWCDAASAAFLAGYLDHAGAAPFLPRDRAEVEPLLRVFLLEKAIYEVGYELNNRPDWVWIPLQGLVRLLEAAA